MEKPGHSNGEKRSGFFIEYKILHRHRSMSLQGFRQYS